jgi:hypothetical protein
MIRIMTADRKETTKLTVEGTLSDEGAEAVQACCMQALSNGKAVRLWLRDVSGISDRGLTMLRRLAAAGVDLTADGVYSSHVVDEIQSASRKHRRDTR